VYDHWISLQVSRTIIQVEDCKSAVFGERESVMKNRRYAQAVISMGCIFD
jgi:hypothetical protein